MSKKERVKGKGADIFFSENQGERAVALPRLEETEEQSRDAEVQSNFIEELATKATFYFTQSQLDALEKSVFLLKQEHRIKTNKSEIMRIACEEMVTDFLENRKDSALYERLAG